MLKIAEICARYHPYIGGIDTHVKEISERFVKAGHDVEVVTTKQTNTLPKHEHVNGVKVTRLGTFAPNDAYYLSPQIYSYLKTQKYDIIHAHGYNTLPALTAAFAAKDTKFVFTPHYHSVGHTTFRKLLHVPYTFLGNYIFSKANKIVCVSKYEKQLLEKTFTIDNKIVIIPNGVNKKDFERFKDDKKDRTRKEKVLLYVGRLEEYKGVQYIIENLSEVQDSILRVVGKGNYAKTLSDLATSLKIDNRIEWYQNLSSRELANFYADADVSIMLSSQEAFGIVTAESLLAGTPCLVANGSALEEFVDGKTCIGIDLPIKKDEFKTSVDKLLLCEDRYQGKIFDWDEVTNELIDLFKTLN